MKLATLKSRVNRDGELLVVSRDLQWAVKANSIAPNLQSALDNWSQSAKALKMLSEKLNAGECESRFPLNTSDLESPLPRAYQWADASAYVHHVELVRKARGAVMPENFWTDPLMYQGGSDSFLGPCDPIEKNSEDQGLDFEAEIAVITDDVPMKISAENAAEHIQLMMLVNDISLRNLIPEELAKGFGFFHSKPSSAFSPVCVTLDELGDAWDGKKLNLPIRSYLNGKLFGEPNAGLDMTFDFPRLIAHAAKTRRLSAGTIVGSGTVSNNNPRVGSSCIAEKRMLEMIATGKASTPFMQIGDQIHIEIMDKEGHSLFGAIKQTVVSDEKK